MNGIFKTNKGNGLGSRRVRDNVYHFNRDRHLATLIVLLGSFLLLAVFAIWVAVDGESPAESFRTIVPVIGAWVGALMAFYFSKESFDAGAQAATAARESETLASLESIPVTQTMIRRKNIITLSESSNNQVLTDHSLPLKDITDFLEAQQKLRRLPIFDRDGAIRYLIHKDMIDEFIAGERVNNPPSAGNPLPPLTFGNILERNRYKSDLEASFGFVPITATLADVKEKMDNINNARIKCRDVFVTKNGKRDEPVEGWVTDYILVQNAGY